MQSIFSEESDLIESLCNVYFSNEKNKADQTVEGISFILSNISKGISLRHQGVTKIQFSVQCSLRNGQMFIQCESEVLSLKI